MRFVWAFTIVALLIMFTGCTREKDVDNYGLEGSWNATWVLADSTLYDLYSPGQLSMSGKMTFEKNNQVHLQAYGFEGCAFASDTAENRLYYQYRDSALLLLNSSNEEVFAYSIKAMEPRFIHLEMMDDIHLKLTR